MYKFKIERKNTSFGISGLNAKHEWINIGCAKNNNDIEKKLLNYIIQNKNNLTNIENTKIRILDRINNSEIISILSEIHNTIIINNLFELFEKIQINKIIELEKKVNSNIKIDWFRGRILLPCLNPYDNESYIKATSNGSNTLIIHYNIINQHNENISHVFGILTSDEIPEIAKNDLTIYNYEYNTNYEWLKDKNIYTKTDSITIMNNNDKYKYYQNSSRIWSNHYENKLIFNGNYKVELYHDWY